MELQHNVVGWFEIPVTDMERSIRFYEKVFGFKLSRHKMGSLDMAWFPSIEGSIGSSGSLVHQPEHYKPSPDGILIYFTTTSGDINEDLKKVEKAGGKVLSPKTKISEEIGYMALILDSEGNRIAFHSRT